MGEMQPIKPVMRHSERVKMMLELNAAGNRAICQPDGTIVSEPMPTKPDTTDLDHMDWRRHR